MLLDGISVNTQTIEVLRCVFTGGVFWGESKRLAGTLGVHHCPPPPRSHVIVTQRSMYWSSQGNTNHSTCKDYLTQELDISNDSLCLAEASVKCSYCILSQHFNLFPTNGLDFGVPNAYASWQLSSCYKNTLQLWTTVRLKTPFLEEKSCDNALY